MLLPLQLNNLLESAVASASISGSFTEAQIVSGGQEIVITLSNDTWVSATFDAQRQNIIDGLDSAQSELLGWNNEVRDKEVVGAVVRTSDTVVTITLTASPSYDVTADEVITVTIPATALTGGVELTGTTAVTVEAFVASRKGGRRRPKRYVVEVDGQFIQVRNIAEAEVILKQVRDLAEESAERDVKTPVTPKPPRIKVKTGTGKVTTSKTLQKAVRQTQKTVNQAYIRAAQRIKDRQVDREIAVLISDKLAREEEENAILALLL